jgi:hypothetical protein
MFWGLALEKQVSETAERQGQTDDSGGSRGRIGIGM